MVWHCYLDSILAFNIEIQVYYNLWTKPLNQLMLIYEQFIYVLYLDLVVYIPFAMIKFWLIDRLISVSSSTSLGHLFQKALPSEIKLLMCVKKGFNSISINWLSFLVGHLQKTKACIDSKIQSNLLRFLKKYNMCFTEPGLPKIHKSMIIE